jgi:hypothetical protein
MDWCLISSAQGHLYLYLYLYPRRVFYTPSKASKMFTYLTKDTTLTLLALW